MALSGVIPSRYDKEIFNMKSNSVKPKKPRYMIGKSLLLSFCLAASFTVSGAEQEQSELELYTQFLERYEKYSQSQASAVFDISRESVQARAQQAEALLAEVQSIDLQKLPHHEQVILKTLSSRLEFSAHEDDSYFLTFSAAPYRGGIMFSRMPMMLAAQDLSTPAGREAWLGVLSTFSQYIRDLDIKHKEQKERGILLPKPALLGIRDLYKSQADIVQRQLEIAVQKIAEYDDKVAKEFKERAVAALESEFISALQQFADTLGDEYFSMAPERGGLWQYPGGPEEYRWLIKQFIAEDVGPKDLFKRAQGYVDDLEAKMAMISKDMGFSGSSAEFKKQLWTDLEQRPKNAQDIKDTMLGYTAEISEQLPKWFGRLPKAPHSAKAIDPELAKTVDRGYFAPPNPMNPVGIYYFKGFDMPSYIYSDIAHLAAHELIPGHHFHVSLMLENESLPPVMRSLGVLGGFSPGITEAWAEYAANLGVEMGVFDTPLERYGILGQTLAMGATAAVVDIGYNYYGWSYEEAEAYLDKHCWGPDCVPGSTSTTFNGSV
ncbi:MAG: DUF885 domain-containing protein, partial [SAR324 cluster bacterium]|nr:DUF885 domain-containing protein [SAR324 cluster bacterium]